jgi:hypothetical protein
LLSKAASRQGDFLPDWPSNLMERGDYNHVDLMVGYTKAGPALHFTALHCTALHCTALL